MIKISYIFPGQGAQQVGMGKEFYEHSPQARNIFDRADAIIPGLKDIIFNGPADQLTSTAYCQPGIFTLSVAILKALEAHPIFGKLKAEFACGLSLGEYSALVASGALSFEETLRLVERRSFFMEEATKLIKGTMAAVIGLNEEKLLALCGKIGVEVANFNSPEQIVITGVEEKIEKAIALIKEAGAKRVIPLDVSGAFHSSLMLPAAVKFEEELKKVHFQKPKFPILSNVDAISATDPETIRRNLAKQMTSSVQWVKTIERIAQEGIETFFELGPGTVLKGLIRRINPSLCVVNIEKPVDILKILTK